MSIPKKQLKESITRMWDSSSESYDSLEGHGIQSETEKEVWKNLFREYAPPGKLEVLDVGCGTCEIGLLFAEMGHHVTGIDLSEKMLAKARAKAKNRGFEADFRKGDAEEPPFEEGTFDLVVNRHLLWTLPHPENAVRNWRRVLKEGGKLLVIDGIWRDESPEGRLRRLASDLATLLVERRNPWQGFYSREVNSNLPNPYGAAPEKTLEYFRGAGFENPGSRDLKEIIELQKKEMPFRKRIAFDYAYHLTYGEK
ncbi:MAG: class I SAM-dependent methyltransferase [Methanosarcinaceae archaeon]|nr:class I SAM-dependent methyltransferase [Methanosarcinaceae archaeon]